MRLKINKLKLFLRGCRSRTQLAYTVGNTEQDTETCLGVLRVADTTLRFTINTLISNTRHAHMADLEITHYN